MQITILQIGKTKHAFIAEAEAEYLKRLGPYTKLNQHTLKEGRIQDSRQVTMLDEAKFIEKALPANTFLIALDETGKQFSSVLFAEKIKNIRDFGQANITFVIGGPYGLHPQIKSKAQLILGFSQFTFTHEMIRMLLLEQLYRAFTILANKTYHF